MNVDNRLKLEALLVELNEVNSEIKSHNEKINNSFEEETKKLNLKQGVVNAKIQEFLRELGVKEHGNILELIKLGYTE